MKELLEKYRELIVYFFVGVATTLVNWASYAAGVELLGWSISFSNVVAWIVAVLFAFVTNKLLVFCSYDWTFAHAAGELALFIGARLLTGVIEMAGVPLLVRLGLDQEFMGVRGMWAKICVSVVVLILNYVFSKLIVFRKK